jgi:hypothetical protein
MLDRLIAVLAAMVFAVPTAFFVWFFLNNQIALLGTASGFFGSSVLWAVLGVFIVIAVLFESFFPKLLFFIWRLIIKIGS